MRTALRAMIEPSVTLAQVYQAVKALEHKMVSGPVAVVAEQASEDAPGTEVAGEALDGLGL